MPSCARFPRNKKAASILFLLDFFCAPTGSVHASASRINVASALCQTCPRHLVSRSVCQTVSPTIALCPLSSAWVCVCAFPDCLLSVVGRRQAERVYFGVTCPPACLFCSALQGSAATSPALTILPRLCACPLPVAPLPSCNLLGRRMGEISCCQSGPYPYLEFAQTNFSFLHHHLTTPHLHPWRPSSHPACIWMLRGLLSLRILNHILFTFVTPTAKGLHPAFPPSV